MTINKKNFNRFMTTALTASLVASAIVPVAAASDVAATKKFSDVKETDSHYPNIMQAVERGLFNGYADGTFKPYQDLKRSQVAKVLANYVVSKDGSADYATYIEKHGLLNKVAPFSDVSSTHADKELYFASLIVKDAKVFEGSNNNLMPTKVINRQQMSKVLVSAFGLKDLPGDLSIVTDNEKAFAEFVPYINILSENGVTNVANFNPTGEVKRAQMASFLNRAYDVANAVAPAVKSVEAINATTLSVSFEGIVEAVTITLEKALVANEETEVTFEYKGEKYTATVTWVVTVEVKEVPAITTNFVEVTFDALAEAKKAAVVVKDSKGNVVKTKSNDLVKGATSAQFDFVTAVDKKELTGIWTVNGVNYSFDAIEQLKVIIEQAKKTPVNELKLLEALTVAGIKNVDKDSLREYAKALKAADAAKQLNRLADVQTVVDKFNKESGEHVNEAAVVKAVADATNQVQLLKALEDNFKLVNSDWIVDYAKVKVTLVDKTAKGLLALDANNYVGKTTAATAGGIQAAIDLANAAAIDHADQNAKTAVDQAKVTALIEKWSQADDANKPALTPKADAIELSKIKEAKFTVAEATTQNSLYNALIAYAKATPDSTLKVSELNEKLKADYFAAINEGTVRVNVITSDIKVVIVQKADALALARAAQGIVDLTATSTTSEVKTALQNYADFTSHAADKFEMTSVNDALLVEYRTELQSKELADVNTATKVTTLIASVNGAANVDANVKTVANANSTTLQVRNALTELAAGKKTKAATAYLNLSSQAKTEVAQFVLDNQAKLAKELTAEIIVADVVATELEYKTAVIQKAMADHEAKLVQFNAIGDLKGATNVAVKTALDTFNNAGYAALTVAQKLAVAEEISKLTKIVTGKVEPLNFGGTDAVTTLAQANAYIDAAIATK